MLKLIPGMAPNVLATEAIGKVTDHDYQTTLIPLAEKMIAKGPIRMLYVVGTEAAGFELEALWDDADFGVKHWNDFSDIAFVTDQTRLRAAMSLVSSFFGAHLELFSVADSPEAKDWISRPAQA